MIFSSSSWRIKNQEWGRKSIIFVPNFYYHVLFDRDPIIIEKLFIAGVVDISFFCLFSGKLKCDSWSLLFNSDSGWFSWSLDFHQTCNYTWTFFSKYFIIFLLNGVHALDYWFTENYRFYCLKLFNDYCFDGFPSNKAPRGIALKNQILCFYINYSSFDWFVTQCNMVWLK